MTSIHSQPPKLQGEKKIIDFHIDCEGTPEDQSIQKTLKELETFSTKICSVNCTEVPWFPTKLEDFDCIGKNTLTVGTGLVNVDHPGFKDKEYRDRRAVIGELSGSYSMKDRDIPRIEYTKTENEVWGLCFDRLEVLHKKSACKEFNWTI
mmetsp:Transcript_32019/g.31322  ORF Transcript_32019/g.31322 Transcript_32019/m.31322 type:complete len:150 (-) Transcript_32019:759-1208(-)